VFYKSFVPHRGTNCRTTSSFLLFQCRRSAKHALIAAALAIVLHLLLQYCVAQTASIIFLSLQPPFDNIQTGLHLALASPRFNPKIPTLSSSLNNFLIPHGKVSQIQRRVHPFLLLSSSACVLNSADISVCMAVLDVCV